MKIVKEDKSERLLIHVDSDLHKVNKKILDEIFIEIENLKKQFAVAGIPFAKDAFCRVINEGYSWMTDFLYDKLKATYLSEGFSEAVIENLKGDERARFQTVVAPIEPVSIKIKKLLNQIELSPDQIPFNAQDDPIINNELKEILSEKSKRYAVGTKEIELFHVILKWIEKTNELEASLAKNGFPLMFTKYLNFDFPMPNCESDHFAYPICLANYDNVLIDLHAKLEFNPEYFEDIRFQMKAVADRQALEREMRSMPNEVIFRENHSPNIPAATFRLPKDTGKILDEFLANTDPDKVVPGKDRWKGLSGR